MEASVQAYPPYSRHHREVNMVYFRSMILAWTAKHLLFNPKIASLFADQVLYERGEKKIPVFFIPGNLQEGETSLWSDFMPVKHIKPEVPNIASNRPMLPTPLRLVHLQMIQICWAYSKLGGKARGYLQLFHSNRPGLNLRNEPWNYSILKRQEVIKRILVAALKIN